MSETRNTIVILVGPEYEDLEVWYPKLRLEEAGFETKLAGIGEPTYRGKHGYPASVDGHCGIFCGATQGSGTGGWAPDAAPSDFSTCHAGARGTYTGKPLVAPFAMGRGAHSAGTVRGRTLTLTVGIRDDVINAARVGRSSRRHRGNIVSARVPANLPRSRCDVRARGPSGRAPPSICGQVAPPPTIPMRSLSLSLLLTVLPFAFLGGAGRPGRAAAHDAPRPCPQDGVDAQPHRRAVLVRGDRIDASVLAGS
jgi:protease I